MALSACLKGEVAYMLARDMDEAAEKAAGQYADIFGPGNFYIELMDHVWSPSGRSIPSSSAGPLAQPAALAATNDCHYRRQEDAESHDALLCIQTNKKDLRHGPDPVRVAGVLLQERRGDGPPLRRGPRGDRGHLRDRVLLRLLLSQGRPFPARFTPPNGQSLREYFEAVSREGFEARMGAIRPRLRRRQPTPRMSTRTASSAILPQVKPEPQAKCPVLVSV